MHPLAIRRAKAYALDALSYLGVAAATVPLGLLVRSRGEPSRNAVLAMSAVPPIVATLWAAHAEAATAGATWGKRRMGLEVVDDDGGGRLSYRRALVRNVVKIAVPWQLGHTVAVGAAFGGFDERDPLTIAATTLTYPLIAVGAATAFWGSGRGVHDRAAGSVVVSA
ncbi:RDD domain containing protein [Beutenbergia cavernae DSM 12333]|uniref:RDD domain containing protein n=1 Tax=Beutenbergia cavernae (strain ATCC BAA-8 / DSM 12333 / CCUG 43141 / JCM 11478 / NBRC 16432 / NCIMB 13614 / HKI 0122) TaxID=471853 RepID=C5C1Y4_BEUC1|nr:RDD family protein [Beutenbergia cavernae]ACQ79602.1 RDD domain containing protein [Beutenbergia cavernae DSM 12333]